MRFLSEDKNKGPILKLLRVNYRRKIRNRLIKGTDGSGKVVSEVRQIGNKNELIVVMLDLIPDNPHTIDVYERLVELKKYEGYKNLVVLPIPGIEYYIIRSVYGSSLLGKSEMCQNYLNR